MKKVVFFVVFFIAAISCERSYANRTSAISGADTIVVVSRVQLACNYTKVVDGAKLESNILSVSTVHNSGQKFSSLRRLSSCTPFCPQKQKPNRPIQIAMEKSLLGYSMI